MRQLKIFNSIPEALTYGLLILMLILNIVGLSIGASNAQQAKVLAAQAKTLAAQNQKLAEDYQAQTLAARQANMERQDRIIGHIDCIVLLAKTHPEVNFQDLSLAETKGYINQCADVVTK